MTTVTTGIKTLTVALAGSPNTGKSTVFNRLTGLSQHVGNWPGKTVEQKTGTCRHGDIVLSLVDLPGSYSFSANSLEEEIARDYVAREALDVLVVVVDAASLERKLYLVREALELGGPLVVALNMMDVAASEGLRVDAEALEAALGVPVVPMTASRGMGVSDLLVAVEAVAADGATPLSSRPSPGARAEGLLEELGEMLPADLDLGYPRRWALLKLLEGDAALAAAFREALPEAVWQRVEAFLRQHDDAVLDIVGVRYEWAAEVSSRVLRRPQRRRVLLGEWIDHVVTHPLGGILTFVAMLFGIYWLMFTVAAPAQGWLDKQVIRANDARIESALEGSPHWLVSLLTDGVLNGAGLVLTFAPILVILFVTLALLEDVGYMARAALVMDRFMQLIGLRGRSFLPLFIGWGCNVPAILGARIVDSPGARLTTIMVAPLMPCAARMVVLALFTGAFFSGMTAILVSWSMVTLNLAVLAVVALLLTRFVFSAEERSFVMELPRYHVPNLGTVLLAAWQRLLMFVKLAGTVIVAMSLVVWVLSTFPAGEIEDSVMGMIGRGLEPLGGLVGLDWQMIVGLLTSFVAKEQTVATLGVILGVGGENGEALKPMLTEIMVPAAAIAFLALQMLFIPCVATVGAIWKETRSWRWTGFSIGYMLFISFTVALLIYQTARLFGLGV
jgi:ferrous iron transport protein B